MSSKEQIMKTKNVRGGNMKGYTIVEYCEGKAVRGSDNWVTLSVLLGMTDFSEGEVDATGALATLAPKKSKADDHEPDDADFDEDEEVDGDDEDEDVEADDADFDEDEEPPVMMRKTAKKPKH